MVCAAACAPPSLEAPVDAPVDAVSNLEPVSADVVPLSGNAPLRVTVMSTLGAFAANECDLRVLGVSTGANLADDAVEVEVEQTSSVALVCERGVNVGVDEHLVDLSSIASFTASPSVLTPGVPLTLQWQGEHLSACDVTADEGKSPVVVDELGARATHVPAGATTYTLTCEGLGGPITRTLRVDALDVRVSAPPYLTFGGDLVMTVGVVAEASCGITADPALQETVSTGPVDEDLRRVFIPNVEVPRRYTVECFVGAARASASTELVDVAPLVRRFDVVDVGASSITLGWEAVGASACTLDNGSAPPTTIAFDDASTNPFGEESGVVSYAIDCVSSSGLPASAGVTVAWDDVTAPQDLFGVRAVLGSVVLAGELPQGDLRFDDVRVVTGDFIVRDATGPGALVFVGLAEVRGDVVLQALPNVSRLLFPELARARSLTIGGAPSLTCADVAPVVCGLDPPLAAENLDVTPACDCST